MSWNTLKKIAQLGRKDQPTFVQIVEVNGKEYLDIRKHYTDDAGDIKPTTKGVLIPMELIGDLKKAISKIK